MIKTQRNAKVEEELLKGRHIHEDTDGVGQITVNLQRPVTEVAQLIVHGRLCSTWAHSLSLTINH